MVSPDKIIEIYSQEDVFAEREQEPDGATKKEIIEIPGLHEKIQLDYNWTENRVDVRVVDKPCVRPDVKKKVAEIFAVRLDQSGSDVVTIYKIPTILSDVYVVRHDVVDKGAEIVSAGTDFAGVVKEASRKLNVPLDRALAEYYIEIAKKLLD